MDDKKSRDHMKVMGPMGSEAYLCLTNETMRKRPIFVHVEAHFEWADFNAVGRQGDS